MIGKKFAALFFYVVVLLLFFEVKSYAYLDPGTGSYVFQIILAVLFAGSLYAKQFWNKLKERLKKSHPNNEKKIGDKEK